MACDVPLVAAKVGSLKEMFSDNPEWLYEPGNSKALTETLEKRLAERTTAYDDSPTWKDLAKDVEEIMLGLRKERFR